MTLYITNPYISFVESRLFPEFIQYAAFHRLTGALIEPGEQARSVLHAAKVGTPVSFLQAELRQMGEFGVEIEGLIQNEFLITEDYDPLTRLLDQLVTRPIQNPALIYRTPTGDWILVRTSMEHTVYSRRLNDL